MLRSFGSPPLFVEVMGDWPPKVVALHGWGRDRNDFRSALRDLDATSVDLPGFGATPPPPAPWSSAEYASHVATFLGEIGRPVLLVGHSFGGRVAVRLAASEPSLVSGLVLSGAPIARTSRGGKKPAIVFRTARVLHRAGLVSGDMMESMRNRYGSADYRAADGVMREVLVKILQEEYEDDLARIQHPVTLVWGADDLDVPVSVARRACQLLPQCELVVTPGVGHDLPWRMPQALRNKISQRLTE